MINLYYYCFCLQVEAQNGTKPAAAALPKPEPVKPKEFWSRNQSANAGNKFTNPFSYLSDHDDDDDDDDDHKEEEEAKPKQVSPLCEQ